MKTKLILAVLISLAAPLAVSAADAQANWKEHCAKCHGSDGKARTRMGKKLKIRDFSDPKIQAQFTDEHAFNAMKHGLTNKAGKMTMEAVNELSEAEMKALIPLVRALKK